VDFGDCFESFLIRVNRDMLRLEHSQESAEYARVEPAVCRSIERVDFAQEILYIRQTHRLVLREALQDGGHHEREKLDVGPQRRNLVGLPGSRPRRGGRKPLASRDLPQVRRLRLIGKKEIKQVHVASSHHSEEKNASGLFSRKAS
jgi:hypothetical protein